MPDIGVKPIMKDCPICGTKFKNPPSKRKTHCSLECREVADAARMAEAWAEIGNRKCLVCGGVISKEGLVPSQYRGRKTCTGCEMPRAPKERPLHTCVVCGETFRRSSKAGSYRLFCSDACKRESRVGMKRNLSCQFKMFKSRYCETCGVDGEMLSRYGYGLHSHHIDHDKHNDTILNHKTLCSKCHSDEERWWRAHPNRLDRATFVIKEYEKTREREKLIA